MYDNVHNRIYKMQIYRKVWNSIFEMKLIFYQNGEEGEEGGGKRGGGG